MLAAYIWPQSALPGDEVDLLASASSGAATVSVVRQGAEDEEVLRLDDVPIGEHFVPSDASERGCRWPTAARLRIGRDWRSGFYLVTLRAGDDTAHAFVVVRAARPGSTSKRLLVLSTSTWAAYNDVGGPSYYTGGHRVSLCRPLPSGFLARDAAERFRSAGMMAIPPEELGAYFSAGVSFWSVAAGWAQWERFFVRWAESNGYAFEFATSTDLHTVAGLLDPYDLYVSVGHDEYWSAAMRNAVEAFTQRGGNAAFFSGNVAFWQTRYEHDETVQVCHKMDIEADPRRAAEPTATTTMWSDPLCARPENGMSGVSFTRGGYAGVPNAPVGTGGYTLWRPEHWALAGTDLGFGDVLGAAGRVVGYECDGCALTLRDGLPVPTGEDGTDPTFQVLATAPAGLWTTEQLRGALGTDGVGELNWVAERLAGADTEANRRRFAHGRAVMGCFQPGGIVFTTGCTDWSFGLAAGDPAVEQVTRNLLDRLTVRGA